MAAQLEELYDRDYYAWALGQADELRRLAETRPNAAIDFGHLIEEIEGLAGDSLNTVLSQLERLIVHLLKLEYSPAAYPRRAWQLSAVSSRREIQRRLTDRMRPKIEAELDGAYRHARKVAQAELLERRERQAAGSLPEASPYPLERLLLEDWYPATRHGLIDDD